MTNANNNPEQIHAIPDLIDVVRLLSKITVEKQIMPIAINSISEGNSYKYTVESG